MQRQSRCSSVLPRGEHDEVSIGRQWGGRECPFAPVVAVVGEMPAFEIHSGHAEIGDLDPVLGVALFVGQAGRVGGAELGEVHLGQRGMKEHRRAGADRDRKTGHSREQSGGWIGSNHDRPFQGRIRGTWTLDIIRGSVDICSKTLSHTPSNEQWPCPGRFLK